MKRIFTLALTLLCLTFGFLTMEVQAAETSGTCGENVTWVLTDDGILTISGEGEMDGSWEYYASQIKEVIIEEGVTNISYCAFRVCKNLTSVTIPSSVTMIGGNAFEGCNSLTDVTIPDSVTYIDYGAFSCCSSLTSVNIPDSVTEVGSQAFRACSSLSSVTMGDSLTHIGEAAFYECNSLSSVMIPDSVTDIGSSAFSKCSSLSSMVIPDSVTYIGGSAFEDCSSLSSVTIPDSVTEISYRAFKFCISLSDVTIPDGVTEICDEAFRGCISLTDVMIPDGVTRIGGGAFQSCSSVTSVTITGSVTEIGEYAFDDCGSLENVVYLHGTQEQWDQIRVYPYNESLKLAKMEFHEWVEDELVAAASCTENEIWNYVCQYCDEVKEESKPDSAPGHTEVIDAAVEVTCTEDGLTEGKHCSSCGDILVEQEVIKAEGHVVVVDQAVEVSCTTDGKTEGKHCSVCDEVLTKQENVEKLGHKWSKWLITKEPTSRNEGKRLRECVTCGEVVKEVLSMLSGVFEDVKDGDYFALPVDWAVSRNVTNGIAPGVFGPDQNCTRAQVVTFLWRAAGSPEPASSTNPFSDVDANAWYGKAVLWAVEKGITNGMSDSEFGTDMTCTRAQVATFLWRSQGQPAPASSSNPFTDVDASAWYGKAVLWAVENGVTNGMGEGTFAPDGTCTRGQIVTFLYRAIA